MKLGKLMALMTVGVLLTGCSSKEEKLISFINDSIADEQTTLEKVQGIAEKQVALDDLFRDILKKGSRDFEDVESMLTEGLAITEEAEAVLFEAVEESVLGEKEDNKLEKLLEKAEKSNHYEDLKALVGSYRAYREALTFYLEDDHDLMKAYTEFLTTVSSDIAFKELEELLVEINVAMDERTQSYEVYQTAVTELDSQLKKMN